MNVVSHDRGLVAKASGPLFIQHLPLADGFWWLDHAASSWSLEGCFGTERTASNVSTIFAIIGLLVRLRWITMLTVDGCRFMESAN